MKNTVIILICIIIALISGIIGFIIGININLKQDNYKEENHIENKNESIVGTYKTSNWNGNEAVLVLNTDKTAIYPTGSKGTWLLEDGKLYIEFESTYSYADGEIHTQTTKNKVELTIVSGGLLINTHFFEKIKN